jgi:hypothetical protein
MAESSRPSKQFIIRGSIAIGIVGLILLSQTGWFLNLFHKKEKFVPKPSSVVLNNLLTQDCNHNGIPDWEERLWGLDPCVLYTDGKSNAEIIKEKKEALGVTDDTTGSPENQTDAIAQELFSITTALSQNQDVSDADLQNVADQLGASVNVSSVSNKYSLKDIHTVATSPASLVKYYESLTGIIKKYSDSNDQDITIIINAAETGDYSQLPQLTQTGRDYTSIAQQISALSVPYGVTGYDLDIINSFSGMATSFTFLQQMQNNGTQALVGVALYKIYSTRGDTAFYNLQDYLTKYGIISS